MKNMPPSHHKKRLALAALLALTLAACGGEKPETMIASARGYLAKNDPKAAVIQVKNALQENPDLPEARYILGLALLQGGDAPGAETELRKARSLKHPDDLVVPPLARAMLQQGQFKKVIEDFGNVSLTKADAKAQLQTVLATAHAAQGETARAQQSLAAALEADPAYAPALLIQAGELARVRNFDHALALVDSVIAKDAINAEAWKLKGDLLKIGKDRPTEAMAAYQKSIDANPLSETAYGAAITLLFVQGDLKNAGDQLEKLKKVAPNHPQTRYFETLLAFQKQDFKLARELSQQMLKVAPNNVQVLVLAGSIELQSDSVRSAETHLAKVVQAAPGLVLARQLLTSAYLRLRQPEKALSTLLPALKGDGQDASTNALAGEVYLRNGDLKTAEAYFAKAAKQDPQNTRSRTALALTHLVDGKSSGFDELQAVASSDSGTTADTALISAYLRRGEFDKALSAIAALEKKQADNPLGSNLRGRALLAKKDIAGARKAFERSIDIDPTYFPSVASLARLDIADQKPDAARKRFDAVLARNPKHPQALLALAELRAREGGAKAEIADLITKAVNANPTEKVPRVLLVEFHLRNGDANLALSAAQNAVAAISENPELLELLGRTQLASGDHNQAVASYNKMATLQPNSPVPYMRMAQAQLVAKDKKAAGQSLRKALELKPDYLDAQRGLILVALDSKNYAEATAVARTMQKQRPTNVQGYQFEGDIAVLERKWDVAAESYRAALKHGASAELTSKLHSTLSAAGKTADADKLAASWTKDNPKEPVFALYMANAAMVRNDLAGAEKLYRNVIQIAPTNASAYNNLAWITGKLKKEGSIALAEKAIALEPHQPAYIDTLAMLLSDKGDYVNALQWQTRAIELQPNNVGYKFNLAKIHIQGGKNDLARRHLEDLAKLGDKFPAQAEVTALLKGL